MPSGLIVREPYASMIVDGEKKWEIRTRKTKKRGEIYIITNGEIIGKAALVDVKGPFNPEELERFYHLHKVDPETLRQYGKGKKLYAWVFERPKRLKKPIKIEIPKGAIIWVNITKEFFKI